MVLTAVADIAGEIAIDYRIPRLFNWRNVCHSHGERALSWSCYHPFYLDTVHIGDLFEFRADRDYVDFSTIVSGYLQAPTKLSAHLFAYNALCPMCFPVQGQAPLEIGFDVGMGFGTPPYNWTLDYGDGTSDSGVEVDPVDYVYPEKSPHIYSGVATYTVKLTVTDALGAAVVKSIKTRY